MSEEDELNVGLRKQVFDRLCWAGVLIPSKVTDDIMPMVREFAAAEIERLADEWYWTTEHGNEVVSTRELHKQAARLRGELEPVTYDDFPPDEDGAS